MTASTHIERRGELETYFDRTASEAWAKLTSDAPVSGVRATVRAGRDAMRATLLGWLPDDLSDRLILDAGCGAGQLAAAAAERGGAVTGVDLSPRLLNLARDRYAHGEFRGRLNFQSGDMFAPPGDAYDHVVAMDSLIHYEPSDIVLALNAFAERAKRSILFTAAPRTLALSALHAVGSLFPRADRAPAIRPVSGDRLRREIEGASGLQKWRLRRMQRVNSGFYISDAFELVKR